MDKEKIEKLKTAGIILATFAITFGIIVSIAIINFHHAKAHPIVIKIPKSKSDITLLEKNEEINVVTNLKTDVCEVLELANKENKGYYQIGCNSGKYGITEKEIIDKKSHPKLKVGDTVYLTVYEDGKLMVRIDSE